MVNILITAPLPRLLYTLEVIFQHVLQVPYRYILLSDYIPGAENIHLNYTDQEIPKALSIPVSGFLSQSDLTLFTPQAHQTDLPLFTAKETSPQEPHFDVFATIFYIITEYEKQSKPIYDSYERYHETEYHSFQNSWHTLPLVNLNSESLWLTIQSAFPEDFRKPRVYQPEITFDIDQPWRYLHKSFFITAGGLAKKLVTGDLNSLSEQVRALISRKDPNYTFDHIFSICPPERTRFFFQLDRHSQEDTRFTYRHPAIQQLVKNIVDRGYEIGIHPSFSSYLDKKMLAHETEMLSELAGKPVIHSRQHFLRYRLPDTFRHLIDAGIRHDYTLAMYSDIGFRTGITYPYPWFDLEKNEKTELILHPTFFMDRTFKTYLKNTPEDSLTKTQTLHKTLTELGTAGSFLFHNDSLSDSGEWKGWGMAIQQMLTDINRISN